MASGAPQLAANSRVGSIRRPTTESISTPLHWEQRVPVNGGDAPVACDAEPHQLTSMSVHTLVCLRLNHHAWCRSRTWQAAVSAAESPGGLRRLDSVRHFAPFHQHRR